MNTPEVEKLLRERYAAPAFAFLEQVPNATGMNTSRFCDALAMSLWPSRGIHLSGFEIKVSRTDWLKELKDPSKAEEICGFCDYWWIVAGSPDIVREGELPSTWGLLVTDAGTLKEKVKAPLLEARPYTKNFLASVLRRATEQITNSAIHLKEIKQAHEEGYARGVKQGKQSLEWANEEMGKIKERVEIFERVSGVRIQGYAPIEPIGNAVRAVLEGEHTQMKTRISRIKETACEIIKTCDRVLSDTNGGRP